MQQYTQGVIVWSSCRHVAMQHPTDFWGSAAALLVCKCRLEGHRGLVTCIAFLPHLQHVIVSAAEDRTFKVPDN